jgi:hypothetical protein
LEHQQFIEVRIQQRTGNWIQFPVVVMRAPGDVDDHSFTLSQPSAENPLYQFIVEVPLPRLTETRRQGGARGD